LFTSGFIGPQILNFERSLSLFLGPEAFLFHLAEFLLEALRAATVYVLRQPWILGGIFL
jgi:hypothetical protein